MQKILTDSRIRGATVLVMALIMVAISTLIIVFAGNYSYLQSKSTANLNRNQQAFNAAEAGLEFGISYLTTNNAAILANPIGGYLAPYSNSNTTNVVLANNSKFSITYSNPVQSNYTLIQISSVGVSDDGSSTRTISQLVQFGSLLQNPPTMPVESLQGVLMSGSAIVSNTSSGITVASGNTVSLSGLAKTVLSTGTSSTTGNLKSDIQQSVGSLASMSGTAFFNAIFGQSESTVQSSAFHYYTNSVTTNYRTIIAGMTGTVIWIDQTAGTAKFDGVTTVGSAANPVILIVNGDTAFQGGFTFYGFVFVMGAGTTTFTGTTSITGGLATTNGVNQGISSQIIYSPTVINNVRNTSGMLYYAKVSGSWKDF